MIDWNFPKNDYGAIGGINESGVETFRGSQIKSLAREICQNSLDARQSEKMPVSIEFKRFAVRNEDFPGRETLLNAFRDCADMWKNQQDKKTKRFFEQAQTIITENTIYILRVSDFNTTGLTGSKLDFNSDWSNLVKGSGISDKAANAGGSFGIGKSAPYGCSALRTIFYSTLDKDGETASQGVARLVSFKAGNQYTQGQGYYGNTEKNSPIYKQLNLDSNYLRKEPGTDIYIAGFNGSSDWKTEVITAVLDGFLLAIFKDDLIVKVDNIEICKDTLKDTIAKYGETESFKLIKEYYNVLTSDNTKSFKKDFYGGNIELKILENSDYHKKIAITRHSGMKLFDKDRMPTLISYAGVLQLSGSELNNNFRNMENPQHDKWEPGRHNDPAFAKRIYNDLFQTIREMIRSLEGNGDAAELDAEGLGEYLPEQVEQPREDEPQSKIETISTIVTDIEIKERKSSSTQNNLDEIIDINVDGYKEGTGDSGSGTDLGKGHKGKETRSKGGTGVPGSSGPSGEGESRVNRIVQARLQRLRMMCKDKKEGKYSLLFETKEDMNKINIIINYSGEQGTKKAHVVTAKLNGNRLNNAENEISIEAVSKGTLYNVEVSIDSSEYYPMEVVVYGYPI